MLRSGPIFTIRVDDLDLPPEERTFCSRLEALGRDYDVEITLREEEWIPKTVEYIKVFLEGHTAAVAGGYLLKTLADIFKKWAIDRLKRAPQNTEKLIIYGADGKPLKAISVTSESIQE